MMNHRRGPRQCLESFFSLYGPRRGISPPERDLRLPECPPFFICVEWEKESVPPEFVYNHNAQNETGNSKIAFKT
jgi:hypothetical protein